MTMTIKQPQMVRDDIRRPAVRGTPKETQLVLPWAPDDQAAIAQTAGVERQAAL